LHRQPWWQLAPHMFSGEMAVLTLGFLILVGATGNFNSVFYPLAYVHLFLVVFTTQTASSLAVLIALLVFHYALGNSPHPHLWADFLALPITWVIFVFARYQYLVLKEEKKTLVQEERQLIHQEEDVFSFFENTLRPHLEFIRQVLELSPDHPELTASLQTIESELAKVEEELETFLGKENDTVSKKN
jgi:predicted membrane protein